jgi:hypothetical protein
MAQFLAVFNYIRFFRIVSPLRTPQTNHHHVPWILIRKPRTNLSKNPLDNRPDPREEEPAHQQ